VKFPKALVKFAMDLAMNPNDLRRAISDFREVIQEARNLKLPLCSKLDPSFLEDDIDEFDPVSGNEETYKEDDTVPTDIAQIM